MGSEPNAVVSAAGWVAEVLTGTLASAIAVIAIGCFGLMLISGRLSRNRAVQLILGCFIIFGAPSVAAGLMKTLMTDRNTAPMMPAQPAPLASLGAPPEQVSPPLYDPYAGAAVPQKR